VSEENPTLCRNRRVTAHRQVTNARVRPASVRAAQSTHPLGGWAHIRKGSLLNIRYLRQQPSLTSKGTGGAEARGLQGLTEEFRDQGFFAVGCKGALRGWHC